MTFVCAACHAVQDHNTIVCEQCNKPLVFAAPTFVCADCGCDVYDALGEVRERCHTCQWLADHPDPVEREQLRALIDGRER
jgi:predicted amidophosphoribosyltransferase